MRRSTALPLGVTAGLAVLLLTGCAAETDYTGVCVDKANNQRIDDTECEDGRTGYVTGAHGWYYIPAGSNAPAIGSPVSGGSSFVPAGKTAAKGGISAHGGTVSRGGFGGFGGGSGG